MGGRKVFNNIGAIVRKLEDKTWSLVQNPVSEYLIPRFRLSIRTTITRVIAVTETLSLDLNIVSFRF